MRITDIRISLREDDRLKAFATVTLDHCFVVRGIKVIQAADRLFVAMPARRKADGTYQDIAHPIHAEARRMFEDAILGAYREAQASGSPPGAP